MPDPKRTKVNVEQLARLHGHLQQLINNLQQSTRNSLTQQFQNIQQVAAGLDSSEFNLRAHQKVLNAMAMDMAAIREALEIEGEPNLQLLDVGISDPRIDWGFYHEEVQKDKDEIERLRKEEEERAKAELEAAKAEADEKEIERQVEEVKEKAIEAGNDPEEVAEEAEKLLRETKQVADEAGKMMRGEPFDEEVIEKANQKIIEDEKENPSPDFPKGASIFGG